MSGPTLYRLPVAGGNTAAGIYLGAVGAVAGIVLLSIWATTQLTAYRLHFHPMLGAPLVTAGSPYRELLGPAAILIATLGVGSTRDCETTPNFCLRSSRGLKFRCGRRARAT